MRTVTCAIENVIKQHPQRLLDAHVAACAAILSKYSGSPAKLTVECPDVRSEWLGDERQFILNVTWKPRTARKGERICRTIQRKPVIEMAAVGLPLLLERKLLQLQDVRVADYGDRTDYRSFEDRCLLEISGTEVAGELTRRVREKVAQAIVNPFHWVVYVIVCAFDASGHRVHLSKYAIGRRPDA